MLKIPLSNSPASFTWARSVPRGRAVCDVLPGCTFLGKTVWCHSRARLDENCSTLHHRPSMPRSKAHGWAVLAPPRHQTAAPRGIFRWKSGFWVKWYLRLGFQGKLWYFCVWKMENQQAEEEGRLFLTTFTTVDYGVNVFVQQCNLLLVTEQKGEAIDLSLFYVCFLLFYIH